MQKSLGNRDKLNSRWHEWSSAFLYYNLARMDFFCSIRHWSCCIHIYKSQALISYNCNFFCCRVAYILYLVSAKFNSREFHFRTIHRAEKRTQRIEKYSTIRNIKQIIWNIKQFVVLFENRENNLNMSIYIWVLYIYIVMQHTTRDDRKAADNFVSTSSFI